MTRTKKKEQTNESKLKAVVDNITSTTKEIIWEGIKINIKSVLTAEETLSFVSVASSMCFSSDTNDYLPEMKDVAMGVAVITIFTDLDILNDAEDIFKLITYTNLLSSILEYVPVNLYESLVKSVDEKIEYMISTEISQIRKQVEELYINATGLFNQISESFEGLNTEDFKAIVKSVSGNGVDEGKIMEAYLAQKGSLTNEEIIES